MSQPPTLVFDIEVYRNYFLVGFLHTETGKLRQFEMYPGHPFNYETVSKIIRQYRLVSFNGNGYDLVVLTPAMDGFDCSRLKDISDKIIKNNMRSWSLGIRPIVANHIDIMEVAPGVASLKLYGGRLHCPRLQDLPIEPDDLITAEQRELLREYNGNDLRTTLDLFKKLEPQIKLREQMGEQYGIDLRSKSDAQIAEAVIKHEVERLIHHKLEKKEPFRFAGKWFRYRPPAFLKFQHKTLVEAFNTVLNAKFTIAGNGVVLLPKEIGDLKLKIGGSVYRMGIGGLHSSEKSVAHHADGNHVLIDRDVTSYYPSIILNCGLKPDEMGDHFAQVYRTIVNRRIEAKRAGDTVTADSLKICVNGSFGKFGSPYSILYAPKMLIQTTITGQLSLLMLIERLESEGILVVSANTDGVVIKCPVDKIPMMNMVVDEWETDTGFATEATEYKALYSRDVNNYIAVKADGGKPKLKGAYAAPGLQKNPSTTVATIAVIKMLTDGTAIAKTVRECKDITKFVSVRTVKGGAVKNGQYLGKAVRWYYAKGETGTINYKVNGYTVARTEGAKPLMELPDRLPDDLDFDWYIREADSILTDIGWEI